MRKLVISEDLVSTIKMANHEVDEKYIEKYHVWSGVTGGMGTSILFMLIPVLLLQNSLVLCFIVSGLSLLIGGTIGFKSGKKKAQKVIKNTQNEIEEAKYKLHGLSNSLQKQNVYVDQNSLLNSTINHSLIKTQWENTVSEEIIRDINLTDRENKKTNIKIN